VGTHDDLAHHISGRLQFTDAVVPDLRTYNRYLPGNTLRFEGGSGLISGRLALDGEGEVVDGDLRVVGRAARLRFATLGLNGNLDAQLRLRRADLEHRRFVIDGSRIALANVGIDANGFGGPSNWWAEAVLEQARIDWGTPLRLDGSVALRMKDISLLLALFAGKKDYPEWIGNLLDAGEIQANAVVRWDGDALTLDRVAARNDRFDVLARLYLQKNDRRGSLFAKWGVLDVGVALDGETHDVRLAHARKWYDSQPDLLPK
jgi:hypothetical protein